MIPLDELPMRVGVGQFREPTAEQLRFIKQCGCDDFQMNTPHLPGDERWEYEDVAAAVKKAEDAGLRLMSLENVPARFYDKIMLGKPGREDQLDNMAHTVRSLGRAGVPILGYNFMPTGVWRTAGHLIQPLKTQTCIRTTIFGTVCQIMQPFLLQTA